MEDDLRDFELRSILLRPVPNSQVGKKSRSFFGGVPALARNLAWLHTQNGAPLHFLAQIKLEGLPIADKNDRKLPLKITGSLAVFLPLSGDEIYHSNPAVLYFDGPVDPWSAQRPPPDIPAVGGVWDWVDPLGLEGGGTKLKRQELEPEIGVERHLRPRIEDHGPVAEHASDGLQPHRAGGDAARGPLVSSTDLPMFAREAVAGTEIAWSWEFVFRLCQRFAAKCARVILDELRAMQTRGDAHPDLDKLIEMNEGLVHQVEAHHYTPIERPALLLKPRFLLRRKDFDSQAVHWVGIARKAYGPVPDKVIAALRDLLWEIDHEAEAGKPARIRLLRAFASHGFGAEIVRQNAADALSEISSATAARARSEQRRSEFFDERVVRETRLVPVLPGADVDPAEIARPIQMFGLPHPTAEPSAAPEGTIPLLQICDSFGTALKLGHMCLQVWIAPDDLAIGRFDRLTTTLSRI